MSVRPLVDNGSRDRVLGGRLSRVKPVQVLERLGGVADAATLVRLTSRRKLRHALRKGLIVRDARGRYALPGADEALRAASRLSGVLSVDSAAQYYGWELKHRPKTPSVTVPRNRKVAPERRVGVRVRWADHAPGEIDGRATSKHRTVIECAALLPFDEALAIADSALRHRAVSKSRLLELARQMPDRYRARCLRVVQAADGRAANPFESVLRAIALDIPGLGVEPQTWIGTHGRSDLADSRLGLVIEAESFEFHGKRFMLRKDCERYNAFVLEGWLVIRFAWEHVMFDPEYVARVLRGMVALLSRASRTCTCAA